MRYLAGARRKSGPMCSIVAGLLGVADQFMYFGTKSAVNVITKSFATDSSEKERTCNVNTPDGVKPTSSPQLLGDTSPAPVEYNLPEMSRTS